jgi:hypothetical protein
VYPFPEKGEDPVGSVEVYVVTELKEPGMVLWYLHLRRKGRVHSSLVLLVRSVN